MVPLGYQSRDESMASETEYGKRNDDDIRLVICLNCQAPYTHIC